MPEALRLLSAGAAQGVVEAIRAPFLAASGAQIDATFGAVGALAEKLDAGERCDVAILTAAMIGLGVPAGAMMPSQIVVS